MKTWNSSPQQQLSVLPFKIYGQVFWSATNVTYNSIPFVLLSKIFLFFCDKFFSKGKRHLLSQKYIVNVWNYTICYMNLLEFARKFILLYQWTRNLLRGSTISWHLQTQQFLTSLILRAQSDLQLNTLVWHVLKVIMRLVFYNLATSIKSLYVFIIHTFSIMVW